MSKHKLKHSWTIYAHLPNIVDWSLASYKKIMTIHYVEDLLELYRHLSTNIIQSCMLFIMKDDIGPLWEDKQNINGGSFSYKLSNKMVESIWKELSFLLIGETLIKNNPEQVNGITISPKKHFCIIKIWLKSCNYIDPKIVTYPKNLSHNGCIFKKHLTT